MRGVSVPRLQPSNPLRICDGADFPNSLTLQGTHCSKTGGLSGAADSKTGILSLWWRVDGAISAGRQDIFHATSDDISDTIAFWRSTTSTLELLICQAGTNVQGVRISSTSTTYTDSASGWRHILTSWDVANSLSHFYVNGADDRGSTSLVNANLDYTLNRWTLAGSFGGVGGNGINAAIADLYFAPGQFLDFSLAHNRLKFRSASGKPVHLGTNGALPTGVAPLIYAHLDDGEAAANIATNRGTGGNFTNNTGAGGAVATASTSPSD